MARSPPPLKWKNRDDIYDCETLLVDNVFSTVKMREDLPQDRRKLIGRRILEAAIATAMDAIEPISDGRHDAKRIALLSNKTAALLSKLLDHVAGRNADNKADAVAHVLRQLIVVDPSRSDQVADKLFSLHEDARSDAQTLVSALSALRWIGAAAKQKDRRIAVRNKNFGVADQNAFVRVLGEGWFVVTGELPSTKKSRKGEFHFFEFLQAAWKDAGHSPARRNFKPSIYKARRLLLSPASKGSPMTRADLLKCTEPEWGLPEWPFYKRTPTR